MSRVKFVTGTLLISAKQKNVKQYCLLKQLYEIGPRQIVTSLSSEENLKFHIPVCKARDFPHVNEIPIIFINKKKKKINKLTTIVPML